MKFLPAHWLALSVALLVGYWLGTKYPGFLSGLGGKAKAAVGA